MKEKNWKLYLGALYMIGFIIVIFSITAHLQEIRDEKLCVISMEEAGFTYQEGLQACQK